MNAEHTSFAGDRIYLYLTSEHIHPADHIRDPDARPPLRAVKADAIVLHSYA